VFVGQWLQETKPLQVRRAEGVQGDDVGNVRRKTLSGDLDETGCGTSLVTSEVHGELK